jgi:hypothetical protein
MMHNHKKGEQQMSKDGNNGQKARGNGNGKGAPAGGYTPQQRDEYREKQKGIRVEEAAKPNAQVIIKESPETGLTCFLLKQSDYLLMELRKQALGRAGRVAVTHAQTLIQRAEKIQDDMNDLNRDMARALGKRYTQPKAFEDFLKADSVPAAVTGPAKHKAAKVKKEMPAAGMQTDTGKTTEVPVALLDVHPPLQGKATSLAAAAP